MDETDPAVSAKRLSEDNAALHDRLNQARNQIRELEQVIAAGGTQLNDQMKVMVAQKVKAGLTLADAIEVSRRQLEHDANLAQTEKIVETKETVTVDETQPGRGRKKQ